MTKQSREIHSNGNRRPISPPSCASSAYHRGVLNIHAMVVPPRRKGALGGRHTEHALRVPIGPSDAFTATPRRAQPQPGRACRQGRCQCRLSGLLERGLTHAPHRDTLQLLTNALVLTPDEASEFIRAGRRHRGAILAAGSAGSAARNPRRRLSLIASALPPYRLIAPLTPLLGRATEEAVVARLLSRESVRAVDTDGTGGCGRNRLGTQSRRHGTRAVRLRAYICGPRSRTSGRPCPHCARASARHPRRGQPGAVRRCDRGHR